MDCNATQDNLIDYIEGSLDESSHKAVKEHLKGCEKCREGYEAYLQLYASIDQYEEKIPDHKLEVNFLEMLQAEQAKIKKPAPPKLGRTKLWLKQVARVAAVLLLMLCSYLYGLQYPQQSNHKNMPLMKEKVVQAQLESRSASKRIQAANDTKALETTTHKTLKVLIDLMNHDKQVNVRLAAADALAKFYENEMVREALITQLQNEQNPIMQVELIQILIDLQENRILPTIKKLLQEEDTPIFIKKQIKSQINQII